MKEFFARLNSMERRFVIAVLVLVFLVINVLFVWPRFSDWNALNIRMNKANKTVADRDKVIAQSETLKPKIDKLTAGGAVVPPEDQQNEFQRTINNQAAESGVSIISSVPVRQSGLTNAAFQFFTEQAMSLNCSANESQLVDFLYRLGAGNSLIRVRDMSLNPDVPHYNLQANLKLVASFQRKTPVRSAAAATNAPAAKAPPTAKPSITPKAPPTNAAPSKPTTQPGPPAIPKKKP